MACACCGAAQEMFKEATVFDQDIGSWNVGEVTTLTVRLPHPLVGKGEGRVRARCGTAHRPLRGLDARNMACACCGATQEMFKGASQFSQDVNNWDVSNVAFETVRLPHAPVGRGRLAWSGLSLAAQLRSAAHGVCMLLRCGAGYVRRQFRYDLGVVVLLDLRGDLLELPMIISA